MRPGITGWAQVHGRNESTWDERLENDVWYVEHWSLGLDLKIIALTVLSVFLGKGVVDDPRSIMLNLDEERRQGASPRSPSSGQTGRDGMSAENRIRSARENDAGGIVGAIRDGFDPSLLRMFIYGCDGIEWYVRAQIRLRDAGCDTVYTVACAEERIVGCVELRRFPGELFLNYISILADFRSHGLGKHLLKTAIAASRSAGQTGMSLDVLDRNVVARAWYEKLGFTPRYATGWWDVPIPPGGEELPFLLSGCPQADLCQEAFGFSQFRMTTSIGSYEIGRLGKEWFRVVRPEALADPAVATALRRLDPSRRVLALLKVEEDAFFPPASPARRVAVSLRMTVGLDELMERLACP